jgi:hypothetical protein
MLSSAPDFETKFLKNWLAGNGYAVAARSTISTNKVSQEFVNIGKLPLAHLTSTLLDKFDVVVGDLSALKSLSPAENAALKQQVMQESLGVIIRADSSGKATTWYQSNFSVSTVFTKAQLQVPLNLQSQKSKTAKLSIDAAYISNKPTLQALATDGQNHLLAAAALNGAGKLVFTTLNHTYTWMLAGNDKDYSALWSLLIGRSARKTVAVSGWSVATALPSVNEPVQLVLQSAVAPADIRINGIPASPAQNPLVPYQWVSTYWPAHAGWQQTNAGSGTAAWWYVYQKTDWPSLKNNRKIEYTKRYISAHIPNLTETKHLLDTKRIEVPKLYFYLVFLASCTFLWVERKLTA